MNSFVNFISKHPTVSYTVYMLTKHIFRPFNNNSSIIYENSSIINMFFYMFFINILFHHTWYNHVPDNFITICIQGIMFSIMYSQAVSMNLCVYGVIMGLARRQYSFAELINIKINFILIQLIVYILLV